MHIIVTKQKLLFLGCTILCFLAWFERCFDKLKTVFIIHVKYIWMFEGLRTFHSSVGRQISFYNHA